MANLLRWIYRFPIEFGMTHSSRLSAKEITSRYLQFAKASRNSQPALSFDSRLFLSRFRLVIPESFPKELGISPSNLLFGKSYSSKFEALPREAGA
jgi:hypothetical protein